VVASPSSYNASTRSRKSIEYAIAGLRVGDEGTRLYGVALRVR
jgi:hypothetical protein